VSSCLLGIVTGSTSLHIWSKHSKDFGEVKVYCSAVKWYGRGKCNCFDQAVIVCFVAFPEQCHELDEFWDVEVDIIEERCQQQVESRGIDSGHKFLQLFLYPFERKDPESGEDGASCRRWTSAFLVRRRFRGFKLDIVQVVANALVLAHKEVCHTRLAVVSRDTAGARTIVRSPSDLLPTPILASSRVRVLYASLRSYPRRHIRPRPSQHRVLPASSSVSPIRAAAFVCTGGYTGCFCHPCG
jgi:hypothetical protein